MCTSNGTSITYGSCWSPTEVKLVDITLEPKNDISKKEFYKAVNKLISELELNWTLKEINANIEIK